MDMNFSNPTNTKVSSAASDALLALSNLVKSTDNERKMQYIRDNLTTPISCLASHCFNNDLFAAAVTARVALKETNFIDEASGLDIKNGNSTQRDCMDKIIENLNIIISELTFSKILEMKAYSNPMPLYCARLGLFISSVRNFYNPHNEAGINLKDKFNKIMASGNPDYIIDISFIIIDLLREDTCDTSLTSYLLINLTEDMEKWLISMVSRLEE